VVPISVEKIDAAKRASQIRAYRFVTTMKVILGHMRPCAMYSSVAVPSNSISFKPDITTSLFTLNFFVLSSNYGLDLLIGYPVP
jgi:hypothetical protein